MPGGLIGGELRSQTADRGSCRLRGHEGSRVRGLVIRISVVGAIMLAAPIAGARETVTVEYSAPEKCPNRSSFLAYLVPRVGAARIVEPPNESARAYRVTVATAAGGYRAEVRFLSPENRTIVRATTAPDCSYVVESIALITALAIRSQTPPEAEPAEPAPPTAPAPRPPAPPARPPVSTQPRLAARWELGAELAAVQGVGPRIAPGFGLSGRFESARGLPGFRFSGLAFDSLTVHRSGADARFRQVVGQVSVCAGPLVSRGAFRFDPCGGMQAGMQLAQGYTNGERIVQGREVVDPWLAGSLAVWLGIAVRSAYIEAAPELRVPLLRRTYVFTNPRSEVFEVPQAAFGMALSGGVAW